MMKNIKNIKIIGLVVGVIILFSLIGSSTDKKNGAESVENKEVASSTEAVEDGAQQEVVSVDNVPTVKTSDGKSNAQAKTTTAEYFKVVDVVDGDTIKISIGSETKTLRLIGLDTPETVDPRKPVQCFGQEASNKAKELLLGKNIRLESDSTQGELDKYQRLLRYVFLEDGTLYNKWMIANGYAHEYTYDTPYEYQAEFKLAEKTARESQLGLWSPNTCSGNTTSVSEPSAQPTTQPQSTGKYYTSSYRTSKYWYPESCDGWKGLSSSYLESFDSLDSLLARYPSKTKSPECN